MSQKLRAALFAACLSLAIPIVTQAHAEAPPPPANGAATLSPEQARRALETLRDAQKRTQMIDTLRAVANASPQPPAAGTPAPE